MSIRSLYLQLSFLGMFCLLMVGCSPDHNALSLHSVDQQALFSQDFASAHAAELPDGSVHLVLLDDGLGNPPESNGSPVASSNRIPLRQVVHIRLFWNTTNSAPRGDPSATNAAIDWYLTEAGDGNSANMIHYHGAGWVTFESDKDGVSASIKSASLSPAEVRGTMKDPVGACVLNGTFKADWNTDFVRNVVAQLQGGADKSMVLSGTSTSEQIQR